ncbi:helix-turn-helix domain-containing protein [Candidatus Cyanaurora vandensis]|uniref:helix-turn-helix domain-containing protein n=1 Tax=Candidatus Cyanaurora vandensis TaxID=2714958 RepID=UPI00257BCD0A|nr:helix-turn-helix domain-containing protein [Candidatus Cyanaurora vandensis]
MTSICILKSELDKQRYTAAGVARLALAIKATMHYRRWSERVLAKQAGISHVTVNKYVRGNISEPQQEIIKALAPLIYRVNSFEEDKIILDTTACYGEDWEALDSLATDSFDG